MGIMDAVETIITGLIGLIIIGAVIVGIFPMLELYFTNDEVFVAGAVVLALVGLISLVYMVGLYRQVTDDTKEPRQKVSDAVSGFRRE